MSKMIIHYETKGQPETLEVSIAEWIQAFGASAFTDLNRDSGWASWAIAEWLFQRSIRDDINSSDIQFRTLEYQNVRHAAFKKDD